MSGSADNMMQIVDEGSARLNKSKESVIGLDANHLTMCKFGSKNNMYTKVLRRLDAEADAVGTEDGEAEHESRLEKLFESVPSVSALETPSV